MAPIAALRYAHMLAICTSTYESVIFCTNITFASQRTHKQMCLHRAHNHARAPSSMPAQMPIYGRQQQRAAGSDDGLQAAGGDGDCDGSSGVNGRL